MEDICMILLGISVSHFFWALMPIRWKDQDILLLLSFTIEFMTPPTKQESETRK